MADTNTPESLALLCFDYGTKKIGVAVGQTLTNTATPLGVISVRQGKPDWDRLTAFIRAWRPQALIVGDPLTMDGSRQTLTDHADKFARQLTGRFKLPVHRADERLTTIEALVREQKKTEIDHIAAQIILEGWLEQNAGREIGNVTMMAPEDGP